MFVFFASSFLSPVFESRELPVQRPVAKGFWSRPSCGRKSVFSEKREKKKSTHTVNLTTRAGQATGSRSQTGPGDPSMRGARWRASQSLGYALLCG